MPCGRDFDFVRDLRRRIGETVTIFTTSGGESGRGFTGVIIGVSCNVVRLLSDIGPAPGCALGSCCDFEDHRSRRRCEGDEFEDGELEGEEFEGGSRRRGSRRNVSRRRFECGRIRNIGAIVDIPIGRIAAVVFNTIGR